MINCHQSYLNLGVAGISAWHSRYNYVHELNKKLYSILAECTGNKMT